MEFTETPVHTPEDLVNKQSVTQRTSTPYPSHPIPQLQGPFEESIVETTDGSATKWVVDIDAQTRRRDLLENDEYERLCGRKWRQRASEKWELDTLSSI